METSEVIYLSLPTICVAGAAWGIHLFRKRRRERRLILYQKQISREQLRILHKIALYQLLPLPLRRELRGRMAVFLAEKEFEGCQGLRVTEEMRIGVAAMACLLMLHKDLDNYPKLKTILLYPDTFVGETAQRLGDSAAIRMPSARLGESSPYGVVVLSWAELREELYNPNSPGNVGLHEFAHQIDQADGRADGVPEIPHETTADFYARWCKWMNAEYQKLREKAEHSQYDVIDWYGAANGAEFFAVTTEAFFCRSVLLFQQHEALYRLFREFYRVDPAEWHLVYNRRHAEKQL